jgi:hypothetical protein
VLGEIKAFAGVVHAEDQRELDTILNAVTGTR